MSPSPTGRIAACLITLVLAVAAGCPATSLAQTHVTPTSPDQTHVTPTSPDQTHGTPTSPDQTHV
jgi:hypothetical protein